MANMSTSEFKQQAHQLDKFGRPPALLGRHSMFDDSGNLMVTPKREPPSTTLRRNHETSQQFTTHTMGV